MFDAIGSILKWTWWLIILIPLAILAEVSSCSSNMSYNHFRSSVRRSADWGRTERAADKLHTYYVDKYNATPANVSKRTGALAEEVVAICLEKGDTLSAKQIYREYNHGMSDYARKDWKYLEYYTLQKKQ